VAANPSSNPSQQAPSSQRNPDVGMLAIVRNRRGVISGVRHFDGHESRLHLVQVEYRDGQRPLDEQLVWELEPSKSLLEPNEVPRASDPPMAADEYDALVRGARWSAIYPFLDPDGAGALDRRPIASPFHGAVQIDDYQLIPLLKALRMPRINLMIADDVGLGKTIEAGLILSELLLRRRIGRVLILTPASLRTQWRDEMWSKFSLTFDLIDRDSTLKLRRSLGIDANPWRACPKIIASYHYLRQPDVLEKFISAARTPHGSPHLPWDLLIVDEAHNLMPSPFGEDSQLCEMLRLITPLFENRLFLTATPHNGHTRSFTGLLELLDPVRFTRTDELRPAERERVKQVVLRRLKREINARTNPPKFCTRLPPKAIALQFSDAELRLLSAFDGLRTRIRSLIAQAAKGRRLAGSFAIEILGKRLLSGSTTFLDSWRRCKLGLAEVEITADEAVLAASQPVREDSEDDREAEERTATAVSAIGSWMKSFVSDIENEIVALDDAALGLGVAMDRDPVQQNPQSDARYAAVKGLITTLLRERDAWRPDERLVIFTEYKTTLDYLLRRLRVDCAGEEERFLCLYGGMDEIQRGEIKDAFNDPAASVRVLLATDAAAEGLNLQNSARFLLHFDCPWNPARLEQRNGRLDRYGQARDVQVHHFVSEQDADLKFLSYLIQKVDQIREDLGATGELFDEATHQRLIEGRNADEVTRLLDLQIEQVRSTVSVEADTSVDVDAASGEAAIGGMIQAFAEELDLDANSAKDTLEAAMAIDGGYPQLSEPDALERFRLNNPGLPNWKEIVDDTLRKQSKNRTLGPVPMLSFSAKPFLQDIGGRQIFRPRNDTLMLHLGHPLMTKAASSLTRRRFPGPAAVSRWTVRYGDIPKGADSVIVLHVEEIGINELRETFHHWIRAIQLPVKANELGSALVHAPGMALRGATACTDPKQVERAREILDEVEPDLRKLVKTLKEELTEKIRAQLEIHGQKAKEEEDERYRRRQGEVSELIAENTLAKLEREIQQLKAQRQQGQLFETQSMMDELDRSVERKQEELERRRIHYEEVREQLTRERERIVKHLLPKRFTLHGTAQVFPVALEIRLLRPTGGRA
jgi:hypothetical protein